MTNLLTILPEFDIKPFTHILPSLEKALVSAVDLLTLDAVDVAKRAQVPPGEVRKLNDALLNGLHRGDSTLDDDSGQFSFSNGHDLVAQWQTISTLDEQLDSALGGGVATGNLTEFVGESAAGKTQCLLTLLLSVQLPAPSGLGQSALYISTESPLQTTRLSQILTTHPKLTALEPDDKPSLSRIHSTHIHDLEAQDHILHYQVPIIVERHNIGLIVIDSIAANFRPEYNNQSRSNRSGRAGAESFAQRAIQLQRLGRLLHDLAQKHGLAVVVANQVSDRFPNPVITTAPSSQRQQYPGYPNSQQQQPSPHGASSTNNQQGLAMSQLQARPLTSMPPPDGPQQPLASTASILSTDDPLSLDHQQDFFSGWGDIVPVWDSPNSEFANANLKTPSLGLVWTNQLDARIALLKESKRNEEGKWTRKMKVVFCPWAKETEREFELWSGGVRAVEAKVDGEEK